MSSNPDVEFEMGMAQAFPACESQRLIRDTTAIQQREQELAKQRTLQQLLAQAAMMIGALDPERNLPHARH